MRRHPLPANPPYSRPAKKLPQLADAAQKPLKESLNNQICGISPFGKTLLIGLSSMNRLRVLYALQHGELCVNELADRLDLSQPYVSQQLRKLLASRLVCARRAKQKIYYSISDPTLNHFLRLALEAFCSD